MAKRTAECFWVREPGYPARPSPAGFFSKEHPSRKKYASRQVWPILAQLPDVFLVLRYQQVSVFEYLFDCLFLFL